MTPPKIRPLVHGLAACEIFFGKPAVAQLVEHVSAIMGSLVRLRDFS